MTTFSTALITGRVAPVPRDGARVTRAGATTHVVHVSAASVGVIGGNIVRDALGVALPLPLHGIEADNIIGGVVVH